MWHWHDCCIEDAKELIDALNKADVNDDAEFRRLIAEGMSFLSLEDKDMAQKFGAARSWIAGWRKGTLAPLPGMRKLVYAYLIKELCQSL